MKRTETLKHRFNDVEGAVLTSKVDDGYVAVHDENRMRGHGDTRMAAIFDLCQKMRRAEMFSGEYNR